MQPCLPSDPEFILKAQLKAQLIKTHQTGPCEPTAISPPEYTPSSMPTGDSTNPSTFRSFWQANGGAPSQAADYYDYQPSPPPSSSSPSHLPPSATESSVFEVSKPQPPLPEPHYEGEYITQSHPLPPQQSQIAQATQYLAVTESNNCGRPMQTIVHWMHEFEAAAYIAGGCTDLCEVCRQPTEQHEDRVVIITRDRTINEVCQPLCTCPEGQIPSSRYPLMIHHKSHQALFVHARCLSALHERTTLSNSMRVLLPPVLLEHYQKTQNLSHEKLVRQRHWSKLMITSQYDSIQPLEVIAVAPDLIRGSGGTSEMGGQFSSQQTRAENKPIVTSFTVRVFESLIPNL
jgi:hypothetical protein